MCSIYIPQYLSSDSAERVGAVVKITSESQNFFFKKNPENSKKRLSFPFSLQIFSSIIIMITIVSLFEVDY